MSKNNEVLRDCRLGKKLLQKQMAIELGISREHYSRIEEGKIHPGRKLLAKINNLISIKYTTQSNYKSASQIEMCNICFQLKEKDKDAVKAKMMKLIKKYNHIQPLVIGILFQLFFNLDF